ncbi:hypothetical protein PUN28_000032 [Cardiocondyla obscurior]|uniref:Uncharacterized protein n=1 Tax=Cardiocondyla obscurior TaxID=286306 RepID=A0AAW2GXH6_9HYME
MRDDSQEKEDETAGEFVPEIITLFSKRSARHRSGRKDSVYQACALACSVNSMKSVCTERRESQEVIEEELDIEYTLAVTEPEVVAYRGQIKCPPDSLDAAKSRAGKTTENFQRKTINPVLIEENCAANGEWPDPVSRLARWLILNNPNKPKLPEDLALIPT